MSNTVIKHWDSWSREYYAKYDTQEIIEKIIRDPVSAFPRKTFELIQKYMGDLQGKRVCVPASGDNTAVFAFHLLGAKVTSTDISSEQIKNAQTIATKYGWDIEFMCEDSLDFRKGNSGEYDLVYTSNGVGVWISDLEVMYKNFYRVLKDKGYYIMFETHPFDRLFDSNQETITSEGIAFRSRQS